MNTDSRFEKEVTCFACKKKHKAKLYDKNDALVKTNIRYRPKGAKLKSRTAKHVRIYNKWFCNTCVDSDELEQSFSKVFKQVTNKKLEGVTNGGKRKTKPQEKIIKT